MLFNRHKDHKYKLGDALSDELRKEASEHNDPILCMACIDWSKVKIGSAAYDFEQGKLLAKQAFKDIRWADITSTSASVLSRVLKKAPQGRKYEQVVQGFTDELTHMLLSSALYRG